MEKSARQDTSRFEKVSSNAQPPRAPAARALAACDSGRMRHFASPLARPRSFLGACLFIALVTSPSRAAAESAAVARDTVRVVVAHEPGDLLAAPSAYGVRTGSRGLWRSDRLQHATLAFALASGAGSAGARRPEAFAITIALGTAKEARDARQGGFDPVDLAADAIGAALGAWIAARR